MIHGEDGEWIGTLASPEIAAQVVQDRNSNASLGELFNNESQLEFEGFKQHRPLRVGVARFDEHTEALIAITDKHLIAAIDGLLPTSWSQPNNGWTNKL